MKNNDLNPLFHQSLDEFGDTTRERVLTADELGKMFDVSPGTIRRWRERDLLGHRVGDDQRLVDQKRVRRIMDLPLDYMPSPEFEKADAEQAILGPLPESPTRRRAARPPAGVPRYMASLYEVPLLTAEQELHLFRKYNFLKHRAAELRRRLDKRRPAKRVMAEIERLYDEAVAAKNQIIRANLRLVVAVAKRYVTETQQLGDLISDGNESLMRAIEKYDYTRGFKFSTYAVWALKRNCVRNYAMEMKYRDRFRSGPEELFDAQPEHRANPREQLGAQQRREAEVGRILGELPERERRIIQRRFGFGPGESPKTLQEVADEMGVSKERVRQLVRRALETLREVALEQNLEFAETENAELVR